MTPDGKFETAEEAVEELTARFEARACMCCGADSGDGLILPPGWSYLTFPDCGGLAGFLCAACAKRLNVPEARNYAEDLN